MYWKTTIIQSCISLIVLMLENPSSLTLRVNRTQIIMNYDTRPIDQTHQIFSSDHCQCCYSKYFRFDNQSNWTEICCITVTVNIMWSKVCSSLVYGSFWCSSSSGYSHIMLKSVNIPSCIISSVCVTAQIFSRLTVWTMSCIFFQTLKGRLPKYRGTWIKAPEGVCGSGCEIWTLEEHSGSELQWLYLQKQRDQRHQQITHLSIVTGNSCRTNTHFIIKNSSIINQSINGWSEIRPLESRRHWLHHLLRVFDCVWKSWDVSVHLLQLLLHHLLLLLLFVSQCSDCSFFFISEKLMKLLKLLFNLTLCVLSLRLKSNHIHFNHLHQHTSTHHIIQIQEKLRHPTYNRSRSRLLLVIYNNNKRESIILNITNHNYVGLKKPIYCYLSLFFFFWD